MGVATRAIDEDQVMGSFPHGHDPYDVWTIFGNSNNGSNVTDIIPGYNVSF